MSVDFEAEGLLEGITGDAARAARRELLEDLSARGVSLDELKQAVGEGRLALLPAEIALSGGGQSLTGAEVAERAGVDADILRGAIRDLGLPLVPNGERGYDDGDVAAAARVKASLDSGLPLDRYREVTRILGRAMGQVAAAVQGLVAEGMLEPGADELTIARRFEAAAATLGPLMGPTLEHAFTRHLREQLRGAVITPGQLGQAPGAQEVAVCFVDIVGFTKLGEEVPAEQLGDLAERLDELASASVEPPARLVKTIGDAAMLVSTDGPDAVIEGALNLIDAGVAAGPEFPPLRAGVAAGAALARSGDWYGPPVNLASRVTGAARPDSVLVTEVARERAQADWHWSRVGRRRLKGIPDPVELHRARRREG